MASKKQCHVAICDETINNLHLQACSYLPTLLKIYYRLKELAIILPGVDLPYSRGSVTRLNAWLLFNFNC